MTHTLAAEHTHAMSMRLQVIIDDAEYRDLQRQARRHKVTVSEWVRRAIRELAAREPGAAPDRKLSLVREAALGDYPTADIGDLLEQIERGYRGGRA